MLSANDALLKEAAHVLQLDALTFDALLKPIFEYLAKYCLLLTASRDHHHKEPGSFFYHLVETANIAAKQAASRPDLMSNIRLEDRVIYEVVNPMAAWVMGLLHDIAKPMTDFDVLLYSKAKKHINQETPWRPDEETLHDYILRHGAHYYQVLYNTDKTYHLHEQQQMLYINKMLSFFPPESNYRTRLKELLPAAILPSHPLHRLVKEADMKSTKLDTLRHRPNPVIKDWAKAFLDELQMYDRIKRTSDANSLPYFFSKLGIHITYPNGFRRLLQFVQQRYQEVPGEKMPVDPDAWVILLGTQHSVLVPNHASNSYHNPKYEDIKHFVYNVIVQRGGTEEEERVVTISHESIYLDKDIKPSLAIVRYATTKPINKEQIVLESADANPVVEEPGVNSILDVAPDNGNQAELFNEDEGSPLVEESEQATIAPQETDPISAFSPEALQLLAQFEVHDEEKLDAHLNEDLPVEKDLESPLQEIAPTPSKDESYYEEPLDDPAEFLPFKPILNDELHDPQYALHDLASQIPEDHVISALVNSLPDIEKNYPLINWLLFIFNDINQFPLKQLTTTGLNYGFTEAGFSVNQSYLNDAISVFGAKYDLSNATMLCIKNAVKDMNKNTKQNRLFFSGVNGRMRVFTPMLAKAMLYRYRDELLPLLSKQTITLGVPNER